MSISADQELYKLVSVPRRGQDAAARVTDLIYKGADVNKPFRNASTIKSVLSRPAVLGALIKHGANLASPKTLVEGKNVLMLAVEDGNLGAVEQILKHARIHINARAPDGATAMLMAAHRGVVDIAEALVQVGANLHATDREKNHVFHYAASSKSVEMVRYLLRVFPQGVNKPNQWGVTPVMAVADAYMESQTRGDLAVLKELAKASDLQIKDNQGHDVFARVAEADDAEFAADTKREILSIFKQEIEHRMKTLLMVSKRQGQEIPDDVMMKIATLGIDDRLIQGHVERKYSARSKMNRK